MPPMYVQDPLAAVERGVGWRWVDLPVALADAASEAWVVALIALALFAWLEREVKDVVKVFVPLALALAAAASLAVAARFLGGVPRPVGGDGGGLAPLLAHAFPTGQVAAVAAFATYALLVYGRRARPALLLALAVATARVVLGAHWVADLAGGGVVGVSLGGVAYGAVLRLAPEGHLARLRAARRAPPAATGPPSA